MLFKVVNVLSCSELVLKHLLLNWQKQIFQIDIKGLIKKKNNLWKIDQLDIFKHEGRNANLN